MTTTAQKLVLVSQLGLIEGIKAGAFDVAATDVPVKSEITALTTVTTADGTDPATTQALANALKVKINQIIAALKA